MADSAPPYDELAACYDQIFEDWEATIVRQAMVLGGVLHHECGDRHPIRVLDCACGIGTQSLGLAMNGFDVEGCDISSGAVQRARSEALKRGLSVQFSVANMLQLSAISASSFDAVICIDNSLPHLESDEQLLLAAQQAYGNSGSVAHSLAAFATTIALLWKGRQHKAPAFIRTVAEGGLYFKSGIGSMSDIIASICTSPEA